MSKLLNRFLCLAMLVTGVSVKAQDFDAVEIHVLPVRDNIFMLVGAGGNITVQTGNEGVLIIDTQYEQLSDKVLAAIRTLSDKPLRYIINTHHHGDHVRAMFPCVRRDSRQSAAMSAATLAMPVRVLASWRTRMSCCTFLRTITFLQMPGRR